MIYAANSLQSLNFKLRYYSSDGFHFYCINFMLFFSDVMVLLSDPFCLLSLHIDLKTFNFISDLSKLSQDFLREPISAVSSFQKALGVLRSFLKMNVMERMS